MTRPTTPIKVYLAAPWAWRVEAEGTAAQLEREGFQLTHKWWLYDGGDLDDPQGNDFHKECALRDLHAVSESDVVIVLNRQLSEGKAVETGYALALGIPVIVVSYGKRTNIFATVVTEVTNIYDAMTLARSWYPRPVSA